MYYFKKFVTRINMILYSGIVDYSCLFVVNFSNFGCICLGFKFLRDQNSSLFPDVDLSHTFVLCKWQ